MSLQDYIDERNQLEKVIVALCDVDRRCTTCYRYMSVTDKGNCGGCEKYYCECQCEKLTIEQIINGEHP